MSDKGKRLNLNVGLPLISLTTAPTLLTLKIPPTFRKSNFRK
jgi:hypothetical protein